MVYKPLKNPSDAFLVHINEDWEIIYWCKKFGCSKAELKAAIDEVGNSPEYLKLYFLQKQRRAGG